VIYASGEVIWRVAHPPRSAAKQVDGAAGQNELLRLVLEEFPLPISRTGGFPNNRLYSRLNCEELS
jgi:hypothetical protein